MADLFNKRAGSRLESVMEQRRAALLAMDISMLEGLFDETLRYTHSNGTCEDKAGYLDALKRGEYVYHSVEESDIEEFDIGGGIWCTGEVRMHATVKSADRFMHNRFVAVWRFTPSGLRLAAYGATPIATSR